SRWWGRVVAGLLVLGVTSGLPSAQSPTASVSGTIVDETGAAIADVVVALVDAATAQRREATTTAEGTFVIALLPPGRYSMSARREGFTPLEAPGVGLTEHH